MQNSNTTYIERMAQQRPFGWEYMESAPYHFPFEEIDMNFWPTFVAAKYHWALYASAGYLATIFGIQALMKRRQAFELQTPLLLWNIGQGLFSIAGFIRYFPGFVMILSMPNGFYNSICLRRDMTVPISFWTLMMILSKFLDLGDTVFLALRKKKIVLLQWYHHLITLCAAWITAPHLEPVARWYTFMNFGVHSLMYPYFALKSMGIKIPKGVSNLITTLQLAQMIAGLSLNLLTWYYYETGANCSRHPSSTKLFAVIYVTFIALFGKLFLDMVVFGDRKRVERKLEKGD